MAKRTKPMTHTVIRQGDARTAFRKVEIKVRKTKHFYIDEHGCRYKGATGWGTGLWPQYHLNLDTLKEIK